MAPYWLLALVLLAACKGGPKRLPEPATSTMDAVATSSTLRTSSVTTGLTKAPAEPGAPTTVGVPETSAPESQTQHVADIELLRRADALFTFVERWSEALRDSTSAPLGRRGFAAPEVAEFYDTASFTYVRQSENKTSERWHWPLVDSLPELAQLMGHRSYYPQLLNGELPQDGTSTQVKFIEDRHIFPSQGDQGVSSRGITTLTLRPRNNGFVITQELEYPRTKASPNEPDAEVVNWTTRGSANAIVVAERSCSKTANECIVPGALVLVAAGKHSLIFHATQGLGKLGHGQFIDDPERFYLETSSDGTYYGFSFTRRGQTLEIDSGWADAEQHRRVHNWVPAARLGLSTSNPIPLHCVALHEKEPSAKPCHAKFPTL